MIEVEKLVSEVSGISSDSIPNEILRSTRPVVLRGLVKDWPSVQRARISDEHIINYILEYYNNATVALFKCGPELNGRFFYNEDLTKLNFQRLSDKLDNILNELLNISECNKSPTLYVGSTTIDNCLPGFRQQNDLNFNELDVLASIWLGNKSIIAAHHDLPDNIACVVAGKRRFTLFPPEQLENLYIGPMDFTPAGQAISLVDFHAPDYDRYPRFKQALAAAQVATLVPGDALFLPSMWWHHVESLEDFNVLVNYWWRQSPAYMGPPENVLRHAILAIRELPKSQRDAWKSYFDHYIFNEDQEALSHIPEQALGSLGPLTESNARRLRAFLINKLNR